MDVIRFWTWMLSFLQCTRPWTSLGFGHGCSLFPNFPFWSKGDAFSIRHLSTRQGDTVRVFAAARASAECAFALSLAAGAVRVLRVLFDHPSPYAPSLSQCPLLSTSVRDHRGKSFCSCEVGCLAKCPIPTQAARLGGAGPWRFGWHIPPQTPGSDCGARSVETLHRSPDDACGGAKKARGTVSAGRRAPQVDHSLTHSLFSPMH